MNLDRPAINPRHTRSNKTKRVCSSFSQGDDLLNEADQLVKDSNNWLAAHNLNFVERYIQGELEIIVNFIVLKRNEKYDLVIAAIPFWSNNFCSSLSYSDIRKAHINLDSGRCKHFVFVRDAYPVECPKKIVSSFVWLEGAQKREDARTKIIETPFNHFFELDLTVCKGEISLAPTINRSRKNSGGIPSEIKSAPKIVNNISRYRGEVIRKWLSELDFMNVNPPLRIGINNKLVWFRFEKNLDSFLKINKVFLSPRKPNFCVMK